MEGLIGEFLRKVGFMPAKWKNFRVYCMKTKEQSTTWNQNKLLISNNRIKKDIESRRILSTDDI